MPDGQGRHWGLGEGARGSAPSRGLCHPAPPIRAVAAPQAGRHAEIHQGADVDTASTWRCFGRPEGPVRERCTAARPRSQDLVRASCETSFTEEPSRTGPAPVVLIQVFADLELPGPFVVSERQRAASGMTQQAAHGHPSVQEAPVSSRSTRLSPCSSHVLTVSWIVQAAAYGHHPVKGDQAGARPARCQELCALRGFPSRPA